MIIQYLGRLLILGSCAFIVQSKQNCQNFLTEVGNVLAMKIKGWAALSKRVPLKGSGHQRSFWVPYLVADAMEGVKWWGRKIRPKPSRPLSLEPRHKFGKKRWRKAEEGSGARPEDQCVLASPTAPPGNVYSSYPSFWPEVTAPCEAAPLIFGGL